jgi:hypothetical protein
LLFLSPLLLCNLYFFIFLARLPADFNVSHENGRFMSGLFLVFGGDLLLFLLYGKMAQELRKYGTASVPIPEASIVESGQEVMLP